MPDKTPLLERRCSEYQLDEEKDNSDKKVSIARQMCLCKPEIAVGHLCYAASFAVRIVAEASGRTVLETVAGQLLIQMIIVPCITCIVCMLSKSKPDLQKATSRSLDLEQQIDVTLPGQEQVRRQLGDIERSNRHLQKVHVRASEALQSLQEANERLEAVRESHLAAAKSPNPAKKHVEEAENVQIERFWQQTDLLGEIQNNNKHLQKIHLMAEDFLQLIQKANEGLQKLPSLKTSSEDPLITQGQIAKLTLESGALKQHIHRINENAQCMWNENEGLKLDLKRLHENMTEVGHENGALTAENRRIKADNERLKKKASWQWFESQCSPRDGENYCERS